MPKVIQLRTCKLHIVTIILVCLLNKWWPTIHVASERWSHYDNDTDMSAYNRTSYTLCASKGSVYCSFGTKAINVPADHGDQPVQPTARDGRPYAWHMYKMIINSSTPIFQLPKGTYFAQMKPHIFFWGAEIFFSARLAPLIAHSLTAPRMDRSRNELVGRSEINRSRIGSKTRLVTTSTFESTKCVFENVNRLNSWLKRFWIIFNYSIHD